MRFHLKVTEPYSFEHTFRRIGLLEKNIYTQREGVFRRTIQADAGPLLLFISYCQKKESLVIKVIGKCLNESALHTRLCRMFSTNVNLIPFYEQLGDDPVIGNVIRKRLGMHFVLEPSIYECLIKTIISQQLNLTFASTLIHRLMKEIGNQVQYQKESHALFPTAQDIASLGYEDLEQLQFSRRKAEYIIDLSRKIASEELDLESLYERTEEEVFQLLLPIRGIGRWTVECLLLFGLGYSDLLPAQDIGLKNAIQKAYTLPQKPTEEKVRDFKEKWSPYSSYVTFYLWDTLMV